MTRRRLGRGRAWVLWSALGVLAGSAQVSGCADAAPPNAPQTFGFQIALDRIEAPIIVPGSRLRVVGAGYLEGGAWAGRVVGTLGGVTVDRVIQVERRADDLLDLLWAAEAFGDLPEGTFVGRIDLAARYGDATGQSSTAVQFEVRAGLDPFLSRAAPGAFPQTAWALEGDALLVGDEGATTLALQGTFTDDTTGARRDIALNDIPVLANDPRGIDRTLGMVVIAPAWFGIEPGRFEGVGTLSNAGRGWRRDAPPASVVFDLLLPTVEQVSPSGASRGQRVTIQGQGFLGGSEGTTILRIEGTFAPLGAAPLPLGGGALELAPTWRAGDALELTMRADYDFDCQSDDLGAVPGRLEGTVTPIIERDGVKVEGVSAPLTFDVLPSRQVVYLKFLPAFTDSLRLFGLRNLSADVQLRILEVLQRDYTGVNIEFRALEPSDFVDFGILEFGGPDPNGQNLFGLDNTPDLDRCNERLADNLAGRNADGAGYGGIFVESFLQLSPSSGSDNPLASAAFDEVFGPVIRTPATPEDLLGSRADVVRRAVVSLGNLIGSTASHEIGHSLGLPVYPGCGEYHTAAAPAQLMDCGADRPFEERVELNATPPGAFGPDDMAYLRRILPL